MEEKQVEYNEMQLLKRRLYAMRNGVVADALRKAGSPYKMIFGVNLPQIAEIACDFAPNEELAEKAWHDDSTRESMLIAPMLFPIDEFWDSDAVRWIDSGKSYEAIDVLCLKLLRKEPYAIDLALRLIEDNDTMRKYAGMRLICNLAPSNIELAVRIGERMKESDIPVIRQLASLLLSYKDL